MDKVDIYYLEPGDKKSDVISTLGYVTNIYEDEVKNIDDIILNCNNVRQNTISVPSLGYNQNIPKDTLNKAKEKEIKIQYFRYMNNN